MSLTASQLTEGDGQMTLLYLEGEITHTHTQYVTQLSIETVTLVHEAEKQYINADLDYRALGQQADYNSIHPDLDS